jgi:hypothetical protein
MTISALHRIAYDWRFFFLGIEHRQRSSLRLAMISVIVKSGYETRQHNIKNAYGNSRNGASNKLPNGEITAIRPKQAILRALRRSEQIVKEQKN